MEPLLFVATIDSLVWWVIGAAVIIGAATAVGFMILTFNRKLTQADERAKAKIDEATKEADRLIQKANIDAKAEFIKRKEDFDADTNDTRQELRGLEKRLAKREDTLENKLDTLASKERGIETSETKLHARDQTIKVKEAKIEAALTEQRQQLLKVAGLSLDEAKRLLLERLAGEMEQEVGEIIEREISNAKETAKKRAREITVTAIQRYAAEHTAEATVSTVEIPSDDMKGRVIGREGRNIRAFEKASGVDVIVDDTPGVVIVSGFDPVRREVARQALERLVQDGRIHPSRIEEVVNETREEVEKDLLELGKKAAMEANVSGLHRKQLDLLGRLHYRTSYGQNVLRHSLEVAYLCQIMADELGLDGALARRCGLLHDIGKAVDHEVEGGHPAIGADICKRFKEKPEVLAAIAGHHGDGDPVSIYTPLVAAADAISAARPGGRRESLERYIKRLQQLEELACDFPGVSQAYAIQAGREVRVIVDADQIDDKIAVKVARDIAKRIEDEMTYPGEIKVTLIREVRAIEYAR